MSKIKSAIAKQGVLKETLDEPQVVKLKGGQYIGDVHNGPLPSGNIHKNATGLGATTVELVDKTRSGFMLNSKRVLTILTLVVPS